MENIITTDLVTKPRVPKKLLWAGTLMTATQCIALMWLFFFEQINLGISAISSLTLLGASLILGLQADGKYDDWRICCYAYSAFVLVAQMLIITS